MTTGIAMTAHSSIDQLEIKVDYLLYALMDYEEQAELTLSTLPLYDHAEGGPVSFETIQQFVRERRNEIVAFGSHSSDLKKYYSFLAERDIHIGEWRNMKRINGEEGGIKGYFQKNEAFTNHNLFEKLIIPEIGSSLNEGVKEEDGSLQRMFIDTATIAQRLPMLEQREKALPNSLRWLHRCMSWLNRERKPSGASERLNCWVGRCPRSFTGLRTQRRNAAKLPMHWFSITRRRASCVLRAII